MPFLSDYIDGNLDRIGQGGAAELTKVNFYNLMVYGSKIFGNVLSPVQFYSMTLTIVKGKSEKVKSLLFCER